ncbi:hypothetical protein B0H19DRAFT_943452 [Mycena capillaripes]|nr:hypothetical protein B0H19DRAFT_943452 [Mycena capillaripes]
MSNPYIQGGWRHGGNPNAPGSSGNLPPQPSLFGALPYPSRTPAPTLVPFRFASFNPTIFKSTVTGPPHSRVYFRITNPTPAFSVFYDATDEPLIIIEWLEHPVVEIRGIVTKRHTSSWLALAQNSSHRTMEARGKQFVWVPGGEYLFLYAAGVSQPQVYAQVSRNDNSVTLELTTEAIQMGLLEICVAATFLLQCGRNID